VLTADSTAILGPYSSAGGGHDFSQFS